MSTILGYFLPVFFKLCAHCRNCSPPYVDYAQTAAEISRKKPPKNGSETPLVNPRFSPPKKPKFPQFQADFHCLNRLLLRTVKSSKQALQNRRTRQKPHLISPANHLKITPKKRTFRPEFLLKKHPKTDLFSPRKARRNKHKKRRKKHKNRTKKRRKRIKKYPKTRFFSPFAEQKSAQTS